ncbi:MAG: DUF3800 domain-containing protein [Demequina sp.]
MDPYRPVPSASDDPGEALEPALDDIHVDSWDSAWTTDLLEVIAVLTRLVALEPRQAELLSALLAGNLVTTAALTDRGLSWPTSDAYRKAPLGLGERTVAMGGEPWSPILVIADERSDRDAHRQDLAMHRLEGTPGDYWRTTFNLILDTVHFAPSHHSRMLQAADHYAFFVRRRLEVPRERNPDAERAMDSIATILCGDSAFGCGVWYP